MKFPLKAHSKVYIQTRHKHKMWHAFFLSLSPCSTGINIRPGWTHQKCTALSIYKCTKCVQTHWLVQLIFPPTPDSLKKSCSFESSWVRWNLLNFANFQLFLHSFKFSIKCNTFFIVKTSVHHCTELYEHILSTDFTT